MESGERIRNRQPDRDRKFPEHLPSKGTEITEQRKEFLLFLSVPFDGKDRQLTSRVGGAHADRLALHRCAG